MCQVLYLAGMRRAFEPIRVTKIALHHAPDSCTLKVFHMSLQILKCPFLLVFIQQKICVHFENEIDADICERE